MKNALFWLLLTLSAWAQEDFAFDYMAEYDFRMTETAKVTFDGQQRTVWYHLVEDTPLKRYFIILKERAD